MSGAEREPRIEHVESNELQLGPVRHGALMEERFMRARIIYEALGPYLNTNLEQFELNFQRDENPERELQIWTHIALAHQTCLQRHPEATEQDAELAFKAFLLMSMGAARPNDFPAAVWESLKAIYEGL